MTPDQWQRAKQILAMAVEQPRSERAQCVAAGCADDADLRAEVVSLLAAYEASEASEASEGSEGHSDATASAGSPARDRAAGSSAAPPLRHPAAGEIWGGFVLLEELGRGGFGVVYRAYDPALKREVALKLINSAVFNRVDYDMLLREGQMMARVRHPNVVTVYSATAHGDEIGVAMELVEGRTLANIVTQSGSFSAQEASVLGVALCDALQAVHQGGLVHRDIKASNVVRENGGRIVLMDFGAGVQLAAERSESGVIGTPVYMAPDVIAGGRPTVASDLYSLGVLLFYLVTGEYPVAGRGLEQVREAQRRGERKALRDVRSDLPDTFETVVERLLAIEPAQRYHNAVAVRQALRGGETTVPALPPAAAVPPMVARMLGLWSVIAGLVLALGVCGLLGFLSTMALNTALSRTDGFGAETFLAYVVYGVRILIAPAVYVIAALLVYNTAAFIVHLIKFYPPVGNAVRSRRTALRSWLHRTGLGDPNLAARLAGVLGFVALVGILWGFRDLIVAITNNVNTDRPEDLALLSHAYVGTHVLFGFLLDMLILSLSAALAKLWRYSRTVGGRVSAPATGVLVAEMALCLALVAVPWRILYRTELPIVSMDGRSCFLLGTSGEDALVSCPGPIPRNHVVALSKIQQSGPRTVGWLFDAISAPTPDSPASR